MTDGRPYASESGKVRRLVAWELVRALLTTVVVVALFYLLPLTIPGRACAEGDHFHDRDDNPARCRGPGGCVRCWFHRIPDPRNPGLGRDSAVIHRSVCCNVFRLARSDPGNFNVQGLDRTDTLYFAVTIFSTVGFGDIVATSTNGRIVVMLTQMVLDLILIGLGVRALTGAIRLGRERAIGPGRLDRPRE